MRTIDTIDRELRLLSVVREWLRPQGVVGTTTAMDRLLDERLAAANGSQ